MKASRQMASHGPTSTGPSLSDGSDWRVLDFLDAEEDGATGPTVVASVTHLIGRLDRRQQFDPVLPRQVLPAGSDAAERADALPALSAAETRPAARPTLLSRSRPRPRLSGRPLPPRFPILAISNDNKMTQNRVRATKQTRRRIETRQFGFFF